MHTEVHVHGTVSLRNGVTQPEVEQALRPWLDYVDIDGLSDARSAIQDEPGIVFDRRRIDCGQGRPRSNDGQAWRPHAGLRLRAA